MAVNQLSADGRLTHLLTLEGLPLSVVNHLFVLADLRADLRRDRPLAGKLIVNIFFESSTRTRTAFEATAKRLGADVVNLDRILMAGETKQESLSDTVKTVVAMGADGIVLRHGEDGAAARAAQAAGEVSVINGGDGCNAHPTQGLTDAYTLRRRFGEDLSALTVAIVGDVAHSRVARSNLHILRLLGVSDIRLVGPPELCPPNLASQLGAPVINDINVALDGADVVMLLRVQRERLSPRRELTADAARQYFADYGLTTARLNRSKSGAVILHPGPINRGVEIADEVADSDRSLILRQVTNGMAIRAATLSMIIGKAGKI